MRSMPAHTPIYLDHSATTPVREDVLEAMLPFLRDGYGNPGSIHGVGRAARKAIDDSREQVAALINADPHDILFTSGGTEADNLAVRGVIATQSGASVRIVTTAIEHHAVLHACEYVRDYHGADMRVIAPEADGRVDPDRIVAETTDDTALVSMMYANNETGVVQDMAPVAEHCANRGIAFHTDAVQAAGKIPIDVQAVPVSLLALSGHKLYAPKGVGACYIRKGFEIVPQNLGGTQERDRRAGTENVAGIVAFGSACAMAQSEMEAEKTCIAALRDRLEEGIVDRIPGVTVNGGGVERLPTITNITFESVEGESVILGLDMEGIAVSSGAACTSGSLEPSHVLLAMGLGDDAALGAVRFSLGRGTTETEIDRVLDVLPPLIKRLRGSASPVG
jgi:cysteine desulfurase